MRYFLDTEFNGFGGALIAIALVSEGEGTPFYAAITCAYPTPWAVGNVLSLLVADWREDIAHAARLLVTGPGRMKPVRSLRFELLDPDIMGPAAPSQTPHKACHDAMALRATVLAYEARRSRL